jgi:hypothetical protein
MTPVKNATVNKHEEPAGARQPDVSLETPHSLLVKPASAAAGTAPTLPPDIPQYFLPVRGRMPAGYNLVYMPHLYGAARVAFADAKSRTSTVQAHQYLTPIADTAVPVDWHNAQQVEIAPAELEKQPAVLSTGAPRFSPLPSEAGKIRNYTAWQRDFANYLYGVEVLELLYSPSLKLYSEVAEEERDFRIRLSQRAREQRDAAVEALRKKYAPKQAALAERLRRANQAVDREKEQARQAGMQAAISIGATILGAFTGRKSSMGRATTAARGVSRSVSQSGDIGRAEDTVKAVEKQMAELSAAFEAETVQLAERIDPMTEVLQTVTVRPKKADITVQLAALTWAPFWQDESGQIEPAW